MKLNYFKEIKFLPAIKALLKELQLPVNYISNEPTTAQEILSPITYKDNETFRLIKDVYFVGMVDDAAFEGNSSFDHTKIKSDYDGILFFGVELANRENNLLPTRTQLADISRAFNREFHFTPVVVVFKYADNKEQYIAFANVERTKYKQEWREGEKAGKVALLRDISIEKPHPGHEQIIDQLRITTSGTKAIRSFDALYQYWQEVFNVNILNKKFYVELSNWYFWAIKNVTFPSEPTIETVAKQFGTQDEKKLAELITEHNATNVIRLLTRILFTWFIKEKNLIPEDLFDLDALQTDILKEISPYQQDGMFKNANMNSIYYKAILQNLFFASLNCPIEADSVDKRKRGFRELTTADGKEARGKHFAIDWMMRYKDHFKNPNSFVKLLNSTVPFLNGGLFECLDDKPNKIIIDGFSDNKENQKKLIVPDFLFFGLDTEVDLSRDYGSKNKKYKKVAVKGLINILKSYKFTITENTPIEEDVALDPELLGKVFENLLASYNPETKSTARKQTGSFYTPREIVNYMVDKSLIAYLKAKILQENEGVFVEIGEIQTNMFGNKGKSGQLNFQLNPTASEFKNNEVILDNLLHLLVSYDPGNPFEGYPQTTQRILFYIDKCKILDPACGSGAFPMGILQKMVHILQKLDSSNEVWKEVQLDKAIKESKDAYVIKDKQERENKLIEINNAFDSNINDPDYARKLYLIENCIYGVDIQPIATQISKLRFFISLVVDQKNNQDPNRNFGIRPLPNLETKFVTANTLIGIEKPMAQTSLYDTDTIRDLEKELKFVRHKLFGARTKDTKLKYRNKDQELRNAISNELKQSGWYYEIADKLASWDPYDQNASATFFDAEWMFDASGGFDLVIGNPPYGAKFNKLEKEYFHQNYFHQDYQPESYLLFIEKAFQILKKNGVLSYIIPNTWLTNLKYKSIRKLIFTENIIKDISHYHSSVFDAVVDTEIVILEKGYIPSNSFQVHRHMGDSAILSSLSNQDKWLTKYSLPINVFLTPKEQYIIDIIESGNSDLGSICKIVVGMKPYQKGKGKPKQNETIVKNRYFDSDHRVDDNYRPLLRGSDIKQYEMLWKGDRWIKYGPWLAEPRVSANFDASEKIVIRQTGDSLIATMDTDQFVCMNNLHVLTQTKQSNLKFILGLINSKLMNFYYQSLNPEVGEALAEVKKENVSRLQIKESPVFQNIISTLVDIALYNNTYKTTFILIIDALVFNLYFPNHMENEKIDVLKYVQIDLKKHLMDTEFDKLSNSEKNEITNKLYSQWTNPDSEVRNRIKLFAVRSPDIIKLILES